MINQLAFNQLGRNTLNIGDDWNLIKEVRPAVNTHYYTGPDMSDRINAYPAYRPQTIAMDLYEKLHEFSGRATTNAKGFHAQVPSGYTTVDDVELEKVVAVKKELFVEMSSDQERYGRLMDGLKRIADKHPEICEDLGPLMTEVIK